MDHQKIKELISSSLDGELDNGQRKMAEEHLEQCEECRREFEETGRFEEVMRKMQFRKPHKEVWEIYWSAVYNRLERTAIQTVECLKLGEGPEASCTSGKQEVPGLHRP